MPPLSKTMLPDFSQRPLSCNKRVVRCVLVGDGAVGKSSLIVSYTTNGYPSEYVPTAFDECAVDVFVSGNKINLQLCDTAGQDDFDQLRPLCYPGADVFILCFSTVSPTSYRSVLRKWIPELKAYAASSGQPAVPIILVGTQTDLRNDIRVVLDLHAHGETPITRAQGQRLAEEAGADTYIECSSLTLSNLKQVFDTAILTALDRVGSANPGNGKKSSKGASTTRRQHSRTQKAKKGLTRFLCGCFSSYSAAAS